MFLILGSLLNGENTLEISDVPYEEKKERKIKRKISEIFIGKFTLNFSLNLLRLYGREIYLNFTLVLITLWVRSIRKG
jgi:hypothetical protein